MLVLVNQWKLLDWFEWLETDMGLAIGRDYTWAWHANAWAISVTDPEIELLILLKAPDGDIAKVPNSDVSSTV